MKLSHVISLLLVFSASSALASPPAHELQVEKKTTETTAPRLPSKSMLRAQEVIRRQELAEHTSWKWAVGVVVQGKSLQKIHTGILIGMQAQGPSGPVRSIGWLDKDGQPLWVSIQYPDDAGTSWKFRVGDETSEWENDPNGKMLSESMRRSVGFSVDPDTVNLWAVGATANNQWPTKFVSDDAGVHPSEAISPQGKITWADWSKVQTEEGFVLALPGSWELVGKNYQGVFQVGAMEAYKANELPVKGWPFVSKGRDFEVKEEPPIADEKDLDYKSW